MNGLVVGGMFGIVMIAVLVVCAVVGLSYLDAHKNDNNF